jgi:TolB protein
MWSNQPFRVGLPRRAKRRWGESTSGTLDIARIWDARDAGFASSDHYGHLNGSGVHEFDLPDLLPLMHAEDLDFPAPMARNQYNRFIEASRIGNKATAPDGSSAWLTQEVRSDHHGQIGMIGGPQVFHPWFFGLPTRFTGTATCATTS